MRKIRTSFVRHPERGSKNIQHRRAPKKPQCPCTDFAAGDDVPDWLMCFYGDATGRQYQAKFRRAVRVIESRDEDRWMKDIYPLDDLVGGWCQLPELRRPDQRLKTCGKFLRRVGKRRAIKARFKIEEVGATKLLQMRRLMPGEYDANNLAPDEIDGEDEIGFEEDLHAQVCWHPGERK